MEEIADRVFCLPLSISNAYLIGATDSEAWAIVDSGMPGHFEVIKDAAEQCFGVDSRPSAIILTHGHPDHRGSALALAAFWNIPVYAHPMELPYLTGRASLPPADPSIGGPLGFVARFMHDQGADFGDFIQALPADHSIPGLPEWRWVESPGHTPGHISLFRELDRTLIAGDAVITVDADDIVALARKTPYLSKPPAAVTYDWLTVRKSLQTLAGLRPVKIASGHGVPMRGPDLAQNLQDLANDFLPPLHGRYVAEPATFDENGVVYLPPAPSDPLPKIAVGVAVALAIAGGVCLAMNKQKEKKNA